ncbi:MAG: hypothetical protein V4479_00955 [Actinomycetota bacterium]
MLIDFDTLAPAETPARRPAVRTKRSVVEVTPAVALWDDAVLDRILRDQADALERDSVIRSLAGYEHLLADVDLVPADSVRTVRDGTEVFVAGRRMSRSRAGVTIVVTLRDGSGACEVVFTPENLCAGELVLVAGVADGGSVRANDAWDLRELARRYQS